MHFAIPTVYQSVDQYRLHYNDLPWKLQKERIGEAISFVNDDEDQTGEEPEDGTGLLTLYVALEDKIKLHPEMQIRMLEVIFENSKDHNMLHLIIKLLPHVERDIVVAWIPANEESSIITMLCATHYGIQLRKCPKHNTFLTLKDCNNMSLKEENSNVYCYSCQKRRGRS